MIFIDLEKIYDRVPKEVLLKALEKKCSCSVYLSYTRHVRGGNYQCESSWGVTNDFSIRIGLHQGSASSPYPFNMVLDMLTKDIQKSIPNCMMFADDIVLIEESWEAVNSKLEIWRKTSESIGFQLRSSKTKYMHGNFINTSIGSNLEVEMTSYYRFHSLGTWDILYKIMSKLTKMLYNQFKLGG